MSDLIALLQRLGDATHDDLSVAYDALEEIIRLRAENAELRARIDVHEKVCAGVWVPVEERLPEEFETVLVLTAAMQMDLAWQEGGEWDSDTQLDRGQLFTHWLDARMPGEEGEG